MSDAERLVAHRHLQWAQGEGLLDLGEYDVRSREALAARTRGDLDRLLADLPAPPPPPGKAGVFSDTGGGVAMRVLTIVFSSIAALNLVIWGIVSITTGEFLYPWWLWVAAPPAVVLGVLYVSGIGRPRRD